jgi:tryptophan synthase alpha chain
MSYYNPLRQRGDQRAAADLAAAEADAVIVPDLPPEESGDLRRALDAAGLGLVPFLAPTSPAARILAVAALDPVYIYCVALVGVTGARQAISATLGDFLARIRAVSSAPLVVGFGISQPAHVREVARLGAAGVIVASVLADLIEHSPDPVAAVSTCLRDLKLAASAVTS